MRKKVYISGKIGKEVIPSENKRILVDKQQISEV